MKYKLILILFRGTMTYVAAHSVTFWESFFVKSTQTQLTVRLLAWNCISTFFFFCFFFAFSPDGENFTAGVGGCARRDLSKRPQIKCKWDHNLSAMPAEFVMVHIGGSFSSISLQLSLSVCEAFFFRPHCRLNTCRCRRRHIRSHPIVPVWIN